MKTITIVINPDGNVHLQTDGYTGPACLKATAALAEALAGESVTDRPTPEMTQHRQPEKAKVGRG